MTPQDRCWLDANRSTTRPPPLAIPRAILLAGAITLAIAFFLGREPRGNFWGLVVACAVIAGVAAIVSALIVSLPRLAERRAIQAAQRRRVDAVSRGVVEVVGFEADAAWLLSFPEIDTDLILYRVEPESFVRIDLPTPPPDQPPPVPAGLILRRTPGPGAELIGEPIWEDSRLIPLRLDLQEVEPDFPVHESIQSRCGQLLTLSRLPVPWRAHLGR